MFLTTHSLILSLSSILYITNVHNSNKKISMYKWIQFMTHTRPFIMCKCSFLQSSHLSEYWVWTLNFFFSQIAKGLQIVSNSTIQFFGASSIFWKYAGILHCRNYHCHYHFDFSVRWALQTSLLVKKNHIIYDKLFGQFISINWNVKLSLFWQYASYLYVFKLKSCTPT